METDNRKIIVKASPINLYQTVVIWTEKGSETFKFTTDELPKGLVVLANQMDINNIDLMGNDSYLLKIKNDIINNKYSEQKLNVTINKK